MRHKVMATKLFELVADGTIDNEWEQSFIDDIKKKLEQGKSITVNQESKLEELFERY